MSPPLNPVSRRTRPGGTPAPLTRYQIHFVTHGGRVFGSDVFEAAGDAQAIAHARTLYRTTIGKGYEIWQGGRHVHSEVFI